MSAETSLRIELGATTTTGASKWRKGRETKAEDYPKMALELPTFFKSLAMVCSIHIQTVFRRLSSTHKTFTRLEAVSTKQSDPLQDHLSRPFPGAVLAYHYFVMILPVSGYWHQSRYYFDSHSLE